MSTKKLLIGLGLSTVLVGGCDSILEGILGALVDLSVLGIMPAEGFSDESSADHGKVKLALGAEDDGGSPVAPAGDLLEIEPDDGSDVEEGDWEEVPGHDAGSFVLLVDGSGSVESSDQCDGCPTDPTRLRVEAAKALALELGACSGDWRMSLMEFGADTPSTGYTATNVISEWTEDTDTVVSAADQLGSYLGTPLWDSTFEVLDALSDDAVDAFAATDPGTTDSGIDAPTIDEVGIGIVVLSDGTDTESSTSLDELIAHATSLDIAVHTVGFGPASDTFEATDTEAVEGLRRLASETGGYYGFVETVDDLPALTESIAGALCGGHTEMTATFAAPAPSGDLVTGRIRVKNTQVSVPFSFRAP